MTPPNSPVLRAAEGIIRAAEGTALALEAAAEWCLLAPVEKALGLTVRDRRKNRRPPTLPPRARRRSSAPWL
jgi:hypothetical protein